MSCPECDRLRTAADGFWSDWQEALKRATRAERERNELRSRLTQAEADVDQATHHVKEEALLRGAELAFRYSFVPLQAHLSPSDFERLVLESAKLVVARQEES